MPPKEYGFERAPRAPAFAKNAASQELFVKNAGAATRIGSFPPQNEVLGSRPETICLVDLDLGKMAAGAGKVVDHLKTTPRFLTEAARRRPTDPERAHAELVVELATSYAAALMQQIVESHRSATGGTGDTSAVYGPKVELPSVFRELLLEVGEFDWAEAGLQFRFDDYMGVVRRLGRFMGALSEGVELSVAAGAYYLPWRGQDKSVDPVVTAGVKEILRSRLGLEVGSLSLFGAGPQPAWLGRLARIGVDVLPELERDAVVWALEAPRPATIDGGGKRWDSDEFWTLVTKVAPEVDRPPLGDFAAVGANDFKDTFTSFVELWSTLQPCYTWLRMTTPELLRGVVPTLAQDFVVSEEEDKISLAGPAGVPMHSLSMAAAFPQPWIKAEDGIWSRDARFSVATNPDLMRRRWIESFLV